MTSYMTKYRALHPEYREKEKPADNARSTARYANDLVYRENNKRRALERYYRIKAEKQKLNGFIDD
jgi:hypothetical protein